MCAASRDTHSNPLLCSARLCSTMCAAHQYYICNRILPIGLNVWQCEIIAWCNSQLSCPR